MISSHLPSLQRLALLLAAPLSIAATFRYAEDRAPGIVNPLFTTTMSEARIDELLFEGLFADDHDLKSTGRLAQRWDLAPDMLSMTIALRPGATWHDGQPVTADDVVFTIEAMKNPATASTEAGRAAWIKSATAVDPATVKLTFVNPEFAPQDKLHFKILPAHKFSGTTVKRTDAFRTGPVGSGGWQLVSFNGDNSITMQANPGYWQKVGFDEMVLREVSDANYQAKLLVYQSIEALVRVLPRDLATLQADAKVEMYPYQTNSWWYVGFNEADPQLKDARVREALGYLVDVDALLAPIGTGDRVTGPFVPSSPYYDHDVPADVFDANKAADLLKEAGYTWNGRNWIGSDGKELTLKITAQASLDTAQDVVINLQSQLQSHGIPVEPEFIGVAEWKDRVWQRHDFELILSQWSFDRNEDVYEQFHSKGTRNFLGYANPEVDKLLDAARVATDPQAKKADLRLVHALVHADHPMIFLWTLDSWAAVASTVKNVTVHPFYFFTWAADWAQ
jgi:peptide/nickel transport system substrate-binding protein